MNLRLNVPECGFHIASQFQTFDHRVFGSITEWLRLCRRPLYCCLLIAACCFPLTNVSRMVVPSDEWLELRSLLS